VDTQILLVSAGPGGWGELMSSMNEKGMVQDRHVKTGNQSLSLNILTKPINISLHLTSLAEVGLVEWYESGCRSAKKPIRPLIFVLQLAPGGSCKLQLLRRLWKHE
jgi:hypothetical protein